MRLRVERTLRDTPRSSSAASATGLPDVSSATRRTCVLPRTETQSSALMPATTARGHSETVCDSVCTSPFGSG